VRAGSLRKRLTIQRRSQSPDDHGGLVDTWTDLATVWGEIVPGAGSEREVGTSEIREIAQHQITIRYFPGLTPRDRILYGVRVFSIVNVNNVDERNHEMTLTATEGANLG
jgi:SPP1 family predicted phage head-tail adaptor